MTLFHRQNQWAYRTYFKRALKSLAIGAAMAALSACETVPAPQPAPGPQGPIVQRPNVPLQPPQAPTPETQQAETKAPDEVQAVPQPNISGPRDGLTPPHMAGRNIQRVAVILPFSSKVGQLRAEADSLLKAAQMAVFAQEDIDTLLMPFDSQGTKSGTRDAVKQAVAAGADVIVGPIVSASVREARTAAARSATPVIGFSTDQRAAGGGAYLLSFPPEAEINRIVTHARETGVTRFAYLGPDSAYGRRVRESYISAVEQMGGEITASETYQGKDISVMQSAAQRLARFFAETEETRLETDPLAFEAIILPESGVALRTLAPLLTFYEDDLRKVQLLGTGQWQDEDSAREPALNGGLFAGPDIVERQRFQQSYDRLYGVEPGRLASLGFDAVNIASFIADGDPRLRRARLEDTNGFYGIDGLVSFRSDGTPERGLAIYEIRNGHIQVAVPAPRSVNEGS